MLHTLRLRRFRHQLQRAHGVVDEVGAVVLAVKATSKNTHTRVIRGAPLSRKRLICGGISIIRGGLNQYLMQDILKPSQFYAGPGRRVRDVIGLSHETMTRL